MKKTVAIGLSISSTVCCFGTISNAISLSFFLRRKNGKIGDKFLVILNSLDIATCMYALVSLPVKLQFQNEDNLKENFMLWSLFEIPVELSGVVTSFLCALRAISINWPLYTIHRKKVYISFSSAVAYIITCRLTMFHPGLDNIKTEKNNEISVSIIASFTNVSCMVIFVLVCSIVSIKALHKTRPELSGQRSDTNDKAARMVLTLGLLFVAFNTVWITLMLVYMNLPNSNDLHDEESDKFTRFTNTIITYIITCVNSSVNPIVYMTRNEEMNSYLKLTFFKVKNKICKACTS